MLCPNCNNENQPGVDSCFFCGRALGALTQGAVLGSRYEILSLLGKGGMGVVYKARDRMLDEVLALKVLRPGAADTEEAARRFRSEIKLARKVSHPNVCRIHEYGEDGDIRYISMALLEGTDLKNLLDNKYPEGLPPEMAFEAMIQVAEGLKAIHAVGVIHRDLKTPNILRDDDGVVRLMDFGIAKESSQSGGLTATGDVMGSPEYMSPEQCQGKPLDFRSDIYAFGIVLFEVFTGDVPFRGDTVVATLFKHVQEKPTLTGPLGDRLPRCLVPVVEKTLAKSPADRYPSAAELIEALREAQARHAGASAATPSPPAPPRPATPASTRRLRTPSAVRMGRPTVERRTSTRLDMYLDVVLKRLDDEGAMAQEERTVAENLCQGGVRVLTSMTSIEPGAIVRIQEVGGDFETRAAVRHAFKGEDGIYRLGLDFLDRPAPDRLLPVDYSTSRKQPRVSGSRPVPAAAAQPQAGKAHQGEHEDGVERRAHTRLEITLDLMLRRLDGSGKVVQEERTVAENISRGGARVLTSMVAIRTGDVVFIEEVGGDFKTRAEVRSQFTGKDHIPRLGLKFLDRMAPDHLVPPDEVTGRHSAARATGPQPPPVASGPVTKAPPPAPPPPPPAAPPGQSLEIRKAEVLEAYRGLATRNHFEVLGIPRSATEKDVKKAYFGLVRKFHPDSAREPALAGLSREMQAVFLAVDKAHEVLSRRESRTDYEMRLGRPRPAPSPTAAPAEAPQPGSPATTPPPEAANGAPGYALPSNRDRLQAALLDARQLFEKERYWEVIQCIEGALPLAENPKAQQILNVLLAKAVIKNPKWTKRGEEILRGVVQQNPEHVEAHLLLGRIYKTSGLRARAQRMLRRAVELDPTLKEAAVELAELEGPGAGPEGG